jgi:hypothetical protein
MVTGSRQCGHSPTWSAHASHSMWPQPRAMSFSATMHTGHCNTSSSRAASEARAASCHHAAAHHSAVLSAIVHPHYHAGPQPSLSLDMCNFGGASYWWCNVLGIRPFLDIHHISVRHTNTLCCGIVLSVSHGTLKHRHGNTLC